VKTRLSFVVNHIHSFLVFLKRLFKSNTTQRRSRVQHSPCVGVDTTKHYSTASEGLAQLGS